MSCHGRPASPSAINVEKLHLDNMLHSTTRSLPNETLSYIFQFACPKLDVFAEEPSLPGSRFHLVLRLVSTDWYSIVQSTPQLWNSLYMFDMIYKVKQEYIKLCLDRSEGLGLHIYFDPSPSCNCYPCWGGHMIEHNAHRIESLQVTRPTPSWFAKLIPKMLNLKAINFYGATRLPRGPNLKWMSLKAARLDGLYKEPPMTSITYLNLQFTPIDLSIMFLIKCPNLVEFSCLQHRHETSGIGMRLKSTLVLGRLSAFSWSIPVQSNIQFHDQLFERLHVPTLKRFCLDNKRGGPLDTITFLSRLPKSMKELEFRSIYKTVNDRMLRSIVNDAGISRIHVHRCGQPFFMEIFSTLSETTNEGAFRFPNLTCIEVEYPGSPAQYPHGKSWIGEKLALMLQDRTGTTDKFTFVYRNHRSIKWNALTWGIFKELKESGLDLTIIDSGNVVDVEGKYEEALLRDWTPDSDSDSD